MRTILFTLLLLTAPRLALACPVCFGQSDSPMAVATNAGIWVMLGFVGMLLTGFASFFIYLMRRAKRLAASEGTL
jgi:Na+-transporting NADH:ubiquinone oxidoreductase subunit NqrD